MSKLIQQADRDYPIPYSVLAARVAEDWAESCGIDFIQMQDLDGGATVTHVGLASIQQHSIAADPYTTGVVALSYWICATESLSHAADIATNLASEVPAGLVDTAPDRN